MGRLILLLGGNEGDPKKTFSSAYSLLTEEVGDIKDHSSFYESEPWGFEAEQNFINQVIEITTSLAPSEVLSVTQGIEKKLGRKLKTGNGYSSRIIDIDILFYDDQLIDIPGLTIPHPRLHLRLFTLLPLTEKWDDLIHPVSKKTIKQLLEECTDSAWVRKTELP